MYQTCDMLYFCSLSSPVIFLFCRGHMMWFSCQEECQGPRIWQRWEIVRKTACKGIKLLIYLLIFIHAMLNPPNLGCCSNTGPSLNNISYHVSVTSLSSMCVEKTSLCIIYQISKKELSACVCVWFDFDWQVTQATSHQICNILINFA